MMEFKTIRFMRYRKPLAIVSMLLVLVGLGSLVFRGLNLAQDFTGGVSAEINYTHAVEQEAVRKAMESAGFHDVIVQHAGDASTVLVRMPPQDGREADLSAELQKAVNFDAANPAQLKQVDSVGSQVGEELYTQSLLAITLSMALMMIYVAFRYRFKFSVGAIIGLIHDTFFTLGVFSIMQWPFDLTVLAAVLTIIGYSLNDKVVVFDRIRENFRKLRKADAVEITDISLTETLRRTIMTSATVLIVVLALLIHGGDALRWFSVAMLVGVFVVVYSSIYISTAYALAMGLSKEDFIIRERKEVDDRP
jgi:preprotein translocase subunit SecF